MKKLTRISALAISMSLFFSSYSFAEMPNGTIVIGHHAVDANSSTEASKSLEIKNRIANGEKSFIKTASGEWFDLSTNAKADLNAIPGVTYVTSEGNMSEYAPKDGEVLKTKQALFSVMLVPSSSGIGQEVKIEVPQTGFNLFPEISKFKIFDSNGNPITTGQGTYSSSLIYPALKADEKVSIGLFDFNDSEIMFFDNIDLKPYVSSYITLDDARAPKQIKVSNVQQLVDNIGSNRTLILESGVYNLTDVKETTSKTAMFAEAYDGDELVIDSVKKLSIQAAPGAKVEIVTESAYAAVLSFINTYDLKIDGITFGHAVKKGSCTGSVLKFADSDYINISNSDLYGSGTYGIEASSVTNLKLSDSIIRECTYGIIYGAYLVNSSFENSKFYDNREFDLIELHNSSNIDFINTEIFNNESLSFDSVLFRVDSSDNINVINSKITNNKVKSVSSNEKNINFKDTTLKNNK